MTDHHDPAAEERARLYAMYRRACRTAGQRYTGAKRTNGQLPTAEQKQYHLGYMAGLAEAARLIAPSDPTILPEWFTTEREPTGVLLW
jgi:hypothetical protein